MKCILCSITCFSSVLYHRNRSKVRHMLNGTTLITLFHLRWLVRLIQLYSAPKFLPRMHLRLYLTSLKKDRKEMILRKIPLIKSFLLCVDCSEKFCFFFSYLILQRNIFEWNYTYRKNH